MKGFVEWAGLTMRDRKMLLPRAMTAPEEEKYGESGRRAVDAGGLLQGAAV